MIYTDVQTLLDTHLATLVGLPTLQRENTRNIGQVNVAFSRATLMPARSTQVTVGSTGKDQYSGLLQVDLFYPQDSGTTTANTMADAVIAHFPRGLVLVEGDTYLHIQRVWREAGSRIEPFYQVPVMVQWACIA